jgi:hypothetical protein
VIYPSLGVGKPSDCMSNFPTGKIINIVFEDGNMKSAMIKLIKINPSDLYIGLFVIGIT